MLKNLVKTSFKKDDAIVLLKDVTGLVDNLETEEREKRIQSGVHYSEMLPVEYKPTDDYLAIYNNALNRLSRETATAVKLLADKLLQVKGIDITLVSLARAGTPVGVLLKRFFKCQYQMDVPHYSISIIRDKGIDTNALDYILTQRPASSIVFVDGWVGKGAISNILNDECNRLKEVDAKYKDLSSELAVLSDPAFSTVLCGTHADFLIPSACLNATVSGLFSRTFLRNDIIKNDDFHGSVYYENLENEDKTNEFLDKVTQYFICTKDLDPSVFDVPSYKKGFVEVLGISEHFGIDDINKIKPGLGETTRVLLRRIPWKILISKTANSKYTEHILQLAKEKGVEVIEYPLTAYSVVGIIKDMSADL